MSDLIDRQAAIDAIGEIHPLDYNAQAIKAKIEWIPSADIVEVVRCKDCKHCKVLNKWFLYCTLHDIKNTPLIMDNFFCADGERRTE